MLHNFQTEPTELLGSKLLWSQLQADAVGFGCTAPTKTTRELCIWKSTSASVGLPCKQIIGVKTFGFKNVKLERHADNFGREICVIFVGGGGVEPWETRPKIRGENLPTNSLRNLRAIFRKFARPT